MTVLSRRHCLLLGASALASSACTTPLGGTSLPAGSAAQGFRRIALGGGTQVVALSDGVVRRPLDAGFVRNAPLAQVQAALSSAGLPTDHIMVPYTCFVIETGGKRYLLDTGFADNGPAGTGLLHTHMRAAGIDPASIDAVVLSHMHGDHINGLRRKDGTLVYPHATLYVPAPEHAFWMDAARRDAAPEAGRGGFLTVQRVLKDYPAAQLKLFTPGQPVAGGIESIAAFGHSPGHTALAIGSGRQRFTFIGDTAHFPALFVRNPSWQVMFDMDPARAHATRVALLGRVAQEGGLVGGYHFPMPSVGTIRKGAGEGFEWVPAG